jgi:replicative DNA helicase
MEDEELEGISKIISQRQAVHQFEEYTEKRKKGLIPLYKTCYSNINEAAGGSFEPNTMLTIAGMSGSGKSTMSKRIIYSINEDLHAKGKKCTTICFNYEMLALKTIGREVANIAKKTVGTLYSSKDELSDEDFEKLQRYWTKKLLKYDINYVEEPGTHAQIKRTIYHYWKKFCKDTGELDKLMIVEVDHTLLIKSHSQSGSSEKDKIDKLMEDLIAIKKKIASEGGLIFIIVISQLNRDIESFERRAPNNQMPKTSDLMQSSSIMFGTDYLIIGHQPAKLGFDTYTQNKLPCWIYSDKTVNKKRLNMIYYHFLKNRDGEPNLICAMVGNLKYFEFQEISKEQLGKYTEELENGPIYLESKVDI